MKLSWCRVKCKNGINTIGNKKEASWSPIRWFTISIRKVSTHFNFPKQSFSILELRRSIQISNIHGLTKLMLKGSTECVIHIKDEPDYRITCDL